MATRAKKTDTEAKKDTEAEETATEAPERIASRKKVSAEELKGMGLDPTCYGYDGGGA